MCQKMPTIDARTMPIKPMNMNCPTPARLRVVVEPQNASAANMPAVIRKVVAIDSPVYTMRMTESVTPFSAE